MKKKNFTTDSGDNPLIISLSAFTNMSLSLQAKCQKESVVESFLYKVTLSPIVFWEETYCGGRSCTKLYRWAVPERLLYCPVFKAASTSWLVNFLKLSNRFHN